MHPRRTGFVLALLLLSLLLALPDGLAAQSSKKLRNIVFESYEGEVHLSVPGQQQLVPVQRNIDLHVNEWQSLAVITNQGWTEYSLDRRLAVTQEAHTLLTFDGAEDMGRGFVLRLTLERGTTTLRANPGRNNSILIQVSGVELRVTGKARFRIDADVDSTRVTVFDGKVNVVSTDGTREIAKGFSLTYNAGALTRLAQRQRPVRTYRGGGFGIPLFGGVLSVGFGYSSSGPYGWGYCNSYSLGPTPVLGWGHCWWPYGDIYTSPPTPPPAVTPPTPTTPPVTPPTTPPVVTPRTTLADTSGGRLKQDEPFVLVRERGEAGMTATTRMAPTSAAPPRFGLTPDVQVLPVPRAVVRDDSPPPRHMGPIADRVDVQPIPREQPRRGNDSMGTGGNPGSRDSSNQWSGPGGSDRGGYSPSSGSSRGSAGSSSGGSSPAAAPSAPSPAPPPAPPPAAPSPGPSGRDPGSTKSPAKPE